MYQATDELAIKLIDNIPAMLAYWDIRQVCRFSNGAYHEWYGKSREDMIGITLKELLGSMYKKNLPHIKKALAGEKQTFMREITLPDGTVRHSIGTYVPDLVDGKVLGFFVHVADVTPLKILEQELKAAKDRAEELATHDFLTGLPNRVLLNDRIVKAIALAKRKKKLVALLTMDMDGFKSVNDTYGHGEGDRLLQEIARRLMAAIRDMDTATRLGGDEFIVLALELEHEEQVRVVANRILEASRLPFVCGLDTLHPTFSIGIALYPRDGTNAQDLMVSSDKALYEAKRLGKDRFAFASSGA